MARSPLPDPLERRHVLERPLDAAKALRIAEAYLAEERVAEAVAFLKRAGAADRLAALRAQAIAAGDVFLLREVAGAQGEAPRPDEWASLAEAAQRLGKDRYAAAALRQAGRREG